MDLLPVLLLAEGAQDTLSTGNEQTILAYITVTLGAAVVALALFVVKREGAHKADTLQAAKDSAAAVKAVNDELHSERDDRRKQEAKYLKEVIETAQAMSRSLDENTRMGERLASLIERGN